MVHIPKEKKLMWYAKAEKHLLVGYADNVKGYRIYDPVKRCTLTIRDIIIHEDFKRLTNDYVDVSVPVEDTLQSKVATDD